MIFRTEFDSSTFRRNLLLNLLSAFLVVSLVLVFFVQMYLRFRDQEMQQREDMIQTELDYLTEQLKGFSLLFTESQDHTAIRELKLINGTISPGDYYSLYSSRSYLSSITSANNIISDVVLIFPKSGIVVTNFNSFTSMDQFNRHYTFKNFPDELFSLSGENNHTFVMLPGGCITSPSIQAEHPIAFVYRVSLGELNSLSSSCYAYFMLSYDVLIDSLLTESMRALGSLEILDANGNTLCTYSAQDTFSRKGSQVSVSNHSGMLRINAYLPESYFTSVLRDQLLFAVFSIICVFLFSILSAWFVARRQTLPMRRLIADIANEGISMPGNEDEYVWLKNNIYRMNSENADIGHQLKQYRNLVRANALERLFTGSTMTEEQFARAESFCSELVRPFMVSLARFHLDTLSDARNTNDMRALVMLQKLESALPKGSILYNFDIDAIAMLIPCPQGAEQTIFSVEKNIQEMDMPDAYSISITFGVPLTQLQDIAKSFDMVLLHSAADIPSEKVSICRVSEEIQNSDFSFRNLQNLYNLLLSGDYAKARDALHTYLFNKSEQCGNIHQRFYTMRTLMMLAAHAVDISDTQIRRLHYDAGSDIPALFEKFNAILSDFAVQTALRKNHDQDTRGQDILNYIASHFTNPDCCPASIAEVFSISEKYLYTLLKDHANTTPAALLLDYRLTLAAQLLRESKDSVQSISEKAGFMNFNTFYKAFKRAYALAPSQYREINNKTAS